MRIVRFADVGRTHWGFADGDDVRPAPGDADLLDGLADRTALDEMAAAAGDPIELSSVRVTAPIPRPPQFIGVGLNYRDHARESGMEVPSVPIIFGFLTTSIVGDGEAIEIPSFTEQADWEAELGIVIGAGGRDIPEEEALDRVAGYTIVNDVSARDIQMSEGQWTRSKSFDTFKPMGPVIVTQDELGDAGDLEVRLWVNDVEKQASTTSELVFDVTRLVCLLSRSMTLLPGSVISTGTPHGVGFSRTPPEFLRPGDSCTIEIEGIGRLTNPVKRGPA